MKKLYIFLTFLAFHFSFSQIVNIPDANFKALLTTANTTTNPIAFNSANQSIIIDVNGDGEIQTTEANAVHRITIYSNGTISSVEGIRNFTNLVVLSLYNFGISTLDLSDLALLSQVTVTTMPQLMNINTDNCPSLSHLQIYNCGVLPNITLNSPSLTHLQLDNNGNLAGLNLVTPNLQWLTLKNSDIVSLDLSNLNALKNVEIKLNPFLTGINFQNSNTIEIAKFENNNSLVSLDFSGNTNLGLLELLNQASLSQLNISGCIGLYRLKINNSPNLVNLPMTGHPLMNILEIQTTGITSLDLSVLPSLGLFEIYSSPITLLDFSQNLNLFDVRCGGTEVQNIIIKNGAPGFPIFYYSYNPQLQYICTDAEDMNTVMNPLYGYNSNITVNSYCSFVPGGTHYTIEGMTRYDIDGTGCTASDPAQPFQKFNITNGALTGSLIANASGNYSIPVQAGTHTITPVLENPTYFNVTPSSLIVDFPTQTSPLTQNFCLTANGSHKDLEVLIIPATPAAPGFNAQYKIVYKNKGTGVQSGSVTFNYNDNVMNFSTSSIVPDSQNTGLLTWNFSNLNPFESREITVTFVLNTPTATPPLNGGDVLHFTSLVTGLTDETPADNTFTLNQTVVNSFDPNDKTCLQGASISQSQVGDYVHYLIRFENTGTANAQNVVVKDVIDTNKFDINTLIALNASHNFVTRITAPNTVEFIFENIQLPFLDATNDGYVLFKIKTKSTLNNGDSFSNTAGIYFDYNAPIITNTYITTINTLSTSEVETADELYIYPNPVIDILTFKTKEKVIKVEVLDISGRLLRSEGVQHNSLNLSDLKPGNYFIRIYLKNSTITRKITKK